MAKSAETIGKKRVEFLASAKKCKKTQKSAQGYENKGPRFCAERKSAEGKEVMGSGEGYPSVTVKIVRK